MARYLLPVSPLSGHVMPMVRIGAHLAGLGHEITVLTGADHHATAEAAGLRVAPVPVAATDAPSGGRAWLPALLRRYLAGRAELRSMFVAPMHDQYQVVSRLLAAEQFDAVLTDVGFTGVLPLLLGTRSRPSILVCNVSPLTLSSRDTPPFGMGWAPQPNEDYRPMTAFAHRVLFRGVQNDFDRALRSAGAEQAPMFVAEWLRAADGVLQLSVPGLEYPRSDLPDNVSFVGPVLPITDREFARPSWWGELTGRRTVVHVTQGTFDNADPTRLLLPTLQGLADRDDLLVVASTGRRDTRALRDLAPANAVVTEWVPYAELMPHVDVVVTNGGFGGVHHALSHGVPLVVAGETSDKSEVAARVDYAGVGVNVGTGSPSAAQVAAAVERVLGEPGYRSAARRLSAEIAATTPLDTVADRLADSHAVTR